MVSQPATVITLHPAPRLEATAATPEARIRELEAELEALRAGAESATTDYTIMTLDTEGNVTSWNAAGRRMMQGAVPDAPGRTAFPTAAGGPAIPTGLAIQPDWTFEPGRASTAWYSRQDGTRFHAHEIRVPLTGSDQAQGSLCILWEVPDRPGKDPAAAPRRSVRLAKRPVRGIMLAAVLSAPVYIGLGLIVRWLLS